MIELKDYLRVLCVDRSSFMFSACLEVWKVLDNGECVNHRTYPDFMLTDAKKYCRWLKSKDQKPVLYKVSREEVEFDDR